MDIVEILKQDYQRFPKDQTYSIYAPEVLFQDPLNRFRGVDRYRQMIGFIDRWFLDPKLDLHAITRTGDRIETRWTLSWTTPFPWKPRIQIDGWSELLLNPDDQIISHIDYWNCSRWEVVQQLWSQSSTSPKDL